MHYIGNVSQYKHNSNNINHNPNPKVIWYYCEHRVKTNVVGTEVNVLLFALMAAVLNSVLVLNSNCLSLDLESIVLALSI